MIVKLFFIGKSKKSYLVEAEKEYNKRLKHYIKIDEIVISDLKRSSSLRPKEIAKREGVNLLKKIDYNDFVILLDSRGECFSSTEFADFLQKKILSNVISLVFVVGGAFGFSDEVYERANYKLSLSKMTFSHQMVRMIFKEQLYRAFTIIKGEKYHHK